MVLWGVYRVFLEELDPETSLPLEGGESYVLHCADSIELSPQIEEGDTTRVVCPSTRGILASREDPDSFVGYDVTLVDNEFDMGVFALAQGFNRAPEAPADARQVWTPMIGDGMQFKPFRMIIFHAAYEGADIVRYLVTVLNKCTGRIITFGTGQEFAQISYEIRAREATEAGIPVASWGYYEASEAPDDLTGITIEAGIIADGAPTTPDPAVAGIAAQYGAQGQASIAKISKSE